MTDGIDGIKERIDAYIDARGGEMLRLAGELIAIPSPTADRAAASGALRWTMELASSMGFATGMTREGDAGFADLGDGAECVGVLVHVDVVGPGDHEKWTTGPYQPHISDGFLYGRGAVDNKGPVIMSLYAMKAIKELGLPLKKKIRLIVGTSEEGEWTDMKHYKEQFPVPDCGYTPDGNFPIFNAEKGYCDAWLTFGEPLGGLFDDISAGDSTNTVPSRAEYMPRGGEPVVFDGRSMHSSAPECGDNPIYDLAAELREHDFARFLLEHVSGQDMGPALGLDDGSAFLDGEEVGATSAAPTVLRLRDGRAGVNINLRQKVGVTRERIEEVFAGLGREYSFTADIKTGKDGIMVSAKLPHLAAMQRVSREYGIESGFRFAPGTSYAKSMKNFVCWGPVPEGEPDCAHMEDERIRVDTFVLCAKLYALYLAEVCG